MSWNTTVCVAYWAASSHVSWKLKKLYVAYNLILSLSLSLSHTHTSMCIDPFSCCNSYHCNKCQLPDFDDSHELLRRPEGLDILALLPPDCRDMNITEPPPSSSLPPNTNSTQAPPPSTPNTTPNPFTAAVNTTVGEGSTTPTGDSDGEWI